MSSSDEEDCDWLRCANWLSKCMVLSREQLDTIKCVDQLAMFLRDGVLLCLLLNRLHPGAVEPKSFSQRPQMSQFLCLKNIRVFLQSCKKVFGMKDSSLFDASELFEMKDFNKVTTALSALSHTKEAKKSGIEPFSIENDEVYVIMPNEAADDEIYSEHIYGDSTEDADEDVYGQLIDYQPKELRQTAIMSHRDHCIKEILDTEKKYVDVLNMIVETFVDPLKTVLPVSDGEVIFRHIHDLRTVHRDFLSDLARAHCTPSSSSSAENTIPGCFVKHKMKFVVYGKYCANLIAAQERLEHCMKSERVRSVVETKSEEARVKLRDVLVVPFQRILKYHLLIGQLLKDTDDQSPEKEVIEHALEDMQDISMYVNEVKRDSENLALISEIERSIPDLSKYMNPGTYLHQYGRRLHDGEVKLKSPRDRGFETRYAFLFDKVMLICRSRGDTYSYKNVLILSHVDLQSHVAEKGWQCFKLIDDDGEGAATEVKAYTFGLKTDDLKQKWMASIELAQSNCNPPSADTDGHKFRMHTFDEATTCDICAKLLKGVFYQGYRCQLTGLSVHKECIKKASAIGEIQPNGKVKAIMDYSGRSPQPPRNQQPVLPFKRGDVIVVLSVSGNWIQGRLNGEAGYFPRNKVQPWLQKQPRKAYEEPVSSVPSRAPLPSPNPRLPPRRPVPQTPTSKTNAQDSLMDQPWFAGPIGRPQASEILQNKDTGTFLVRYNSDKQEYALSIRFDVNRESVRHIRIYKDEQGFYLTSAAWFESLLNLVEHYSKNSLQDNFPNIQTRLTTPYQRAAVKPVAAGEAGAVGYCIALYDYSATEPGQLSFSADDKIAIMNKTCNYPLWWKGRLNGKTGLIPSNYVKEV